jgi:signal transduction histidine kinase
MVAAWIIPPVLALSLMVVVARLFSVDELMQILTGSPLLPSYIVGWTVGVAIYFQRLTRPVEVMLDAGRRRGQEEALEAARRFPVRYWGLFVLHKVGGPPAILFAAWASGTFVPTHIDLLRTALVATVVSIVVGLAIFFVALDRLGRAFDGVDVQRAHVTIKTKVLLLAALSPLLIDTALVQYYWTKTGYFTTETLFVWLFLELLAIGGALLFLRSFNQSLFPLEELIASDGVVDPEVLAPRSTDELGVLTTRYRSLLRGLTLQKALLQLRANLMAEQTAGDREATAQFIVDAAVDVMQWDGAVLVLQQGDGVLLPVATRGRPLDDRLRDVFAHAKLATQVLEARERMLIEDALNDPRANPAITEALNARAALVTPLWRHNEPLGVLAIFNAEPVERVGASELEAVESLAEEASAAIGRLAERRRSQELESQLLRAQRLEAVGRLAGGVAHDFNNVLAAIVATADLAAAEAEGDLREDLHLILDAAQRGSALTQQLLTFSRRGRVEPVDLSVNEVIKGLSPMLERLIPESIAFRVDLAREVPSVRADPAEIEQIVMNLVVNARDALEGAGAIDVSSRVSDDGSTVLLEVRDNGAGMSEEVTRQIFDPFFSTKSQEKGTGLGLATVYGVVNRVGGTIDVDSAEGEGACFTVSLPASGVSLAKTRAEGAMPVDGPLPEATVLLAEDDPTLRKILARALRQANLDVLEAGDGQEALDVAADHPGPIHALLSDMVMPRLRGPELAARLCEARPDVKVMLMSGYADEHLWSSVEEAGWAVLRKPFLPSEMRAQMRLLLSQSKAARRSAADKR